jgi:DNA (cytosine-5)-methyltransferase 1
MSFNFIEVCAGCGGLSTGLQLAGFEPLLLIDNESNCIKTLKENKNNVNIQKKNIEDLHLFEYKIFII